MIFAVLLYKHGETAKIINIKVRYTLKIMPEKNTRFKKIKFSRIKVAKIQLLTANWEFKKKGRLLQRNRHVKIELSVILTFFRLFHVGHGV